MHPAIWDACLDSFDEDCSHYRDIIQRDRDCELCDKKVHTADRHMRNCVVLFQVAVASAWHRAGAPEHSANTQVNPSMFTAQIVKKLLEEPTVPAPQEDKPLLTFLERHCALCSHAVVNQQDWRRHMKKCHDLEWIPAQAGISGTLEGIALSRPCKFCRVAYTKTPRLHTTKCLPLLQLSFLRHHVRDLSSDVGSRQHVGRSQPMHEDQTDDELQPTKFPKKAGKGAGKLEKRPREPQTAPPRGPKQAHLLTLARMMARHEMALQQLEADRSWVIFVDSGSLGIINQLMRTTATWKKQRSKNECSCSLRQALMGAMLMELEARMVKLETDASAQTPLVRAKILLQDPLRWQYTKWNSDQKAHEPTNGAPLAHTTALTALRELKSLILQEGTMPRIPCNGRHERGERGCHAVQVDPVDGVTSQNIHSRDPYPIHGVLDAPADRSPAAPERSHRPLPKGLQQLLRPEQ